MSNEYLTQDDLCAYLKVSKSSLWRMRTFDQLPFVMAGGSLRYRLADVEEWLDQSASQINECRNQVVKVSRSNDRSSNGDGCYIKEINHE